MAPPPPFDLCPNRCFFYDGFPKGVRKVRRGWRVKQSLQSLHHAQIFTCLRESVSACLTPISSISLVLT